MTTLESQRPGQQRAAELVRDAGGQIVGRTRLQKVAYLLELTGLGTGYQFEYHYFGPYSEDLARDIDLARAFRLVAEEERATDWGGSYSIYRAQASAGSPADGSARAMFAATAARADALLLELAAAAAFLKDVKGEPDPWGRTARLKPQKAEQGRLDQARHLYRQLAELAVSVGAPKPLPPL